MAIKFQDIRRSPVNNFLIVIVLAVFTLSGLLFVKASTQKQQTTSIAATVCKNITSKTTCNADSCCSWSNTLDECKKKDACGGGTTCTTNNACFVKEPNNSCDVSISPSTIAYGGYATVRISAKPTSCTGSVAIDPFAILSLPAGIKRTSGYRSNQTNWGVVYYSTNNNYTFDNMNLSYGSGWYAEFTVRVYRHSGGTINGESWIDLNQTCAAGRGIQLRQDTCNTQFTAY